MTETRSKYGSRAIVVDNIRFSSHAESRRYGELKLLQAAGEIRDLVLQPEFVLAPAVIMDGRRKQPLLYRGDFMFLEKGPPQAGWHRVVEDVKSPATANNSTYRVKRHLMLSVHGIDIREVS